MLTKTREFKKKKKIDEDLQKNITLYITGPPRESPLPCEVLFQNSKFAMRGRRIN